MPVCKACYNRCAVGKNFGAETCASCAAFFRRTVRLKIVYPCKNDFYSCSKDAVRCVSAIHACRKCRFDRCIEVGMQPELVQNARPKYDQTVILPTDIIPSRNAELPLITSMMQAVRIAFQHYSSISTDPRSTIGTSERGANFLTHIDYKLLTLPVYQNFRDMLDYVPIVGDLSKEVKDAIFKNSFSTFAVFVQIYQDQRHHSLQFDDKRFYFLPNVYVDLDPEKLFPFILTHINPQSLARPYDCTGVARRLATGLRRLRKIGLESANFFASEEDVAALLLLIIMQSSTTTTLGYKKYRKLLNIYYGKTAMDQIEEGGRPEETIARLTIEYRANKCKTE
ncbi:hypothetical protein QR680_004381 [Steinernema hermaphroditum]|uniref:Nuclear receptor domain-containing protein n=1 Tax=Steinernema hermaphroditum TaxID=289476 RepID=A0AA39HPM0_9BILA|nr:hypothetical protein QR680_004381 [Steinernema hermaphroditum]